MNEYKFEQRKKKRGEFCVWAGIATDAKHCSINCDCGSRTPPDKKHRTRIVKRSLKNNLRHIINESNND